MLVISLNRRFIVWRTKESGDPDVLAYLWGGDRAGLGWTELLLKKRVVILAEAGSGKSEELQEQARIGQSEGSYTFHATLQNVGSIGLRRALAPGAATQLDAWRSSERPAWFFLDSVDEAKANYVRFADALREVALAIHGAEGRAHI